MKCPMCTKQGLTSMVVFEHAGPKAIGGMEYHDDGGNLHSHDPNFRHRKLHCTNGHEMLISEYDSCPSCDYNEGKTFLLVENRENNTVIQYRFTKAKEWKRVVTFDAGYTHLRCQSVHAS